MKSLIFFLFCFFVWSFQLNAQSDVSDEPHRVTIGDSTVVLELSEDTRAKHARNDTIAVKSRSFVQSKIDQLKSDPSMDYQQPPTVAESLWDRFKAFLRRVINEILRGAVHTNWGRVLVYIIGVVGIIVLVMMILKVNAFRVLSNSAEGAKNLQVLDENIHEMDFDKLIEEAVREQNFRKAIRLIFLNALKLLADKHFIQWQIGKTNQDYLGELSQSELRAGFKELNYFFEYAWYGNFTVKQDTYQRVRSLFTSWRSKL